MQKKENKSRAFDLFCQEKKLSLSIVRCLYEETDGDINIIKCLDNTDIDGYELSDIDKNELMVALDLPIEHEYEVESLTDGNSELENIDYTNNRENPVENINSQNNGELQQKIQSKMWKEFGLAKQHPKWKSNYLQCEMFSPDGFWSWNVAARFQHFKSDSITKIWKRLEYESDWILSPPVMLPDRMFGLKVSFNLRKRPDEEDEDLRLEICFFNDQYNKEIKKLIGNISLKINVHYTFYSIYNGQQFGESLLQRIELKELFDTFGLKLNGRYLAQDKPPIIQVHVY